MERLKISIKRLTESARLPERAHSEDAGWDIFSTEDVVVRPGETVVVPTGLAMEIPRGWYGQIKPRSGLGARGLFVNAGVVDSSYRGEIKVVLVNSLHPGEADFVFAPGDKIAQMVFLPVPEVDFIEAHTLAGSTRGGGGFGSTDSCP